MAVTLPSTPLATQADLDALTTRVAALEKVPPVNKPSPDGTKTTAAGTVLTDKFLAGYSLVADTVRPPFRIARNGATDPVTGNVSQIGIYNQGQCYQWATGGTWVADLNGSWTPAADPTAPPIPPGTIFSVSNGQIHKPDGSVFKGTGIDIWWAAFSNRDGGWNQGNQVIADWTTGAPLLQAFPKLNIIRLACFMDGSGLGGFPTQAELTPLVTFCTNKKIVLLLDPHDYSGGSNWVYSWADGSLAKAQAWVQTMSAAFGNNPYVWMQTENEPGVPNDDEINTIYDAWRTKSGNPLIVGWVTWGYTDRVTRGITNRMRNIGIDLHYYASAAGSNNMNLQDHINWIATTTAAINAAYKSNDGEIPINCFEFGDACCGSVEPAGQIAIQAVTQSAFKSWSAWNWTVQWNVSWGVDVLNNGATPVLGGKIIAPAMVGV